MVWDIGISFAGVAGIYFIDGCHFNDGGLDGCLVVKDDAYGLFSDAKEAAVFGAPVVSPKFLGECRVVTCLFLSVMRMTPFLSSKNF